MMLSFLRDFVDPTKSELGVVLDTSESKLSGVIGTAKSKLSSDTDMTKSSAVSTTTLNQICMNFTGPRVGELSRSGPCCRNWDMDVREEGEGPPLGPDLPFDSCSVLSERQKRRDNI